MIYDCEGDEHDGREPSLGSLDRATDQTQWAQGSRDADRERDLAESGIADNDGLQEQLGRQDWQTGVFG